MKNHVTEISWDDGSDAWIVYLNHRSGKTVAVYFFNGLDYAVNELSGDRERNFEEKLLQ